MESIIMCGADPELMICNTENELVCAIPLVPGTKEVPFQVKLGAVQHDNVMGEFNIDPAATLEEFITNLRTVLQQLAKMVAPHRLVVRASADYPEKALEMPETKIFGCDPDFNAWSLTMNEIDGTASALPFRSSGGHFHFGYKEESKELLTDPYGKADVIRAADIFMGIPSVFMDSDPTAPARRLLYGKAGAHRPKEYGVEYRTLGNFWVKSPATAQAIYLLADLAVRIVLDNRLDEVVAAVGGQERVQDIINNSRTEEAREVFERVLTHYIPAETARRVRAVATIHEVMDFYQSWEIPA